MSDPRYTNPDPTAPRGPDPTVAPVDPLIADPVERDRTGGAMWGWIAGIAVLVLIAFVLIGGWGWSGNSGGNSVARAPAASAPITTGAAPSGAPPAR
jgi:hypothetical protein